MNIINVKNFAIKGYKNKEHVAYFIEGVDCNALLFYSTKDKRFLLSSMTYTGEKTSQDEIIEDIQAKVPAKDNLKIKKDKSKFLWQFQLGKANFNMSYFSNDEIGFYLDQAKECEIKVNKKYKAEKYSYLSGRAELQNILKFASNLEKVNVNEIKEQIKQSSSTELEI